MVVFNRILGVLTGLLVATVIAVSAAALVRPPLGSGVPGGTTPHPGFPMQIVNETTRAPTPAVHTPAPAESA